MPTWFPWILVGGIVFTSLSFTASKFKDKKYTKLQVLQDFISGSILIAFIGVLTPDIFPTFSIPVSIPFTDVINGNELDLQVGPPRLAGR